MYGWRLYAMELLSPILLHSSQPASLPAKPTAQGHGDILNFALKFGCGVHTSTRVRAVHARAHVCACVREICWPFCIMRHSVQ